jgi:acetyl esterase/lipase
MASPEAEAIKQRISTMREVNAGTPTLAEQRAAAEGFGDLAVEPDGIAVSYADAHGVHAMVLTPRDARRRGVLLYFHGGGYSLSSVESHRKIVGHLALAAGVTAVSVEYRLAPEHRHPAQVNDSVTAYRWLLDAGHAPDSIVLAGDSAGGGLALGTLFALRDEGLPQPAAAVAVSAWTDMAITGGSMSTRSSSDLTPTRAFLPVLRAAFIDDDQWGDPRASPLAGDPTGFPPLYLAAGDDETLRDDTLRFAVKASDAGVDVTLDIVPEMQHVFIKAVGSMPEADACVRRIGDFVKRVLGPDE